MAKKRKKVKAETVQPQHTTQPPALIESGFDPRVSQQDEKKHNYKSDSEPMIATTFDKVQETVGYVKERFEERAQKEGEVYYACPICHGAERQFFGKTAKKDCQQHIDKEHKMRKTELKLKKAPKAMYEPKKRVKAPKPTIADLVPPQYREQVAAQVEMAKKLRPLAEQSKALSVQGNHLIKLTTMSESTAIAQLPKLNNEDVVAVYQMATNRGKRLLARAAFALCQKRKLNIYEPKKPSPRAKALQEAMLAHAFQNK